MHTNQASTPQPKTLWGKDRRTTTTPTRCNEHLQWTRRSGGRTLTSVLRRSSRTGRRDGRLGFKTGDWWISAALFAAVLVALRVESDLRNSASNEEFLGRSCPSRSESRFSSALSTPMRSGWLTGAFSAVSAGAL